MATPDETIWKLDPHTLAKHAILKRYLGAWFSILGSKNPTILYVDGFSGPGRYAGGESGSPLVAIAEAVASRKDIPGEVRFAFIEERQDRADHLKTELGKLDIPKNFRPFVEVGQFENVLTKALDQVEQKGGSPVPTFAFIDPFGFKGFSFRLISRLLKHPRCEAFVTFMVDSINRWLEHPDEKVRGHIVEAFGTEEALKIAQGGGNRIELLRVLYQQQLQTAAKFVRYFEMRDRNNRPQYYLFFATNHELGHVKMKEAMWRVDMEGTFRFSDATTPNQAVLFEADPVPPLVEIICKEFEGKGTLTGMQVRKFVEDRTAFLSKHMRDALGRCESNGKLKVEVLKADGKKRRANSFPDEVKLTFVKPPPKTKRMF